MEFVLDFVKDVLSRFDFAYMFVVNLVTYLVIKMVDELNGDKTVPTWGKRTIAVTLGFILGIVACVLGADRTVIFYSFFVSLVSWDTVFKPILKILGDKIDYRKEASNESK